jgi:flavin reductase (DIM6/NTAB) family NADH-FMN oxidoreductase RutF
MKQEIIPEFLWHIDKVALTFQTTIITTVDAQGRVNAAPYGLVYPFSTGSDNPQMLVCINTRWHTAQNILATKEFTINYAPFPLLEQVAVTGRLFDEGVNELEKAGLTAIASLQVKPPRIEECYQHIECRLASVIRPNESQINFIGDIVSISMNEELLGKDRQAKMQAADPLMFLGINIMTFLDSTYGRIAQMRDYTPPTVDLEEKS